MKERVRTALASKLTTAHFDLRFREGSRAAASIDRAALIAERDYEDICAQLGFRPDGRFELFVYDSVAELTAITDTEGSAGFSTGRQSHIPYGNDQTRYHEMVHIIAAQMPKSGEEHRNLFFAEGLANSLLRFVHGVHVHAVAAWYLGEGRLPKLGEMTGARDFYGWLKKRPGFNAYDVGASWFRYLIDEHGIVKVRAYYTGTPAADAFDKTEAELEDDWRKMLSKYPLRPSLRTLLAQRGGQPAEFTRWEDDPDRLLPTDLRSDAPGWFPLMDAKMGAPNPENWQREGGEFHGKASDSDWDISILGEDKFANGALFARVRPAKGTVGVQVQFGTACQLLLTNAGTFLYDGGVLAASRAARIANSPVELLLVRKGRRLAAYVDGIEIVTAEGADGSALPGIGVAGGAADFESVRVLPLPAGGSD